MSDAQSDVPVLDTVVSEPHHMRLDSGASTASSDYGDGAFSNPSKLRLGSSWCAYSPRVSLVQLLSQFFLQLGRLSRHRLT
jgi:hypothetical protein